MNEELEQSTNQSRGFGRRSGRFGSFLTAAVFIGAVIIVIVLARGPDQPVVRDSDTYQAVFLDNGQVYFGKLHGLNDDFWSLTDIYYLRAGGIQQGADLPTSQIDLIKLGAELHAPRDEMIIGKSHVIFYEDVGAESEVVRLIQQHKSGTSDQ